MVQVMATRPARMNATRSHARPTSSKMCEDSLLRHEVEEALLHERVMTARRLVEQEHVRARHERRYDRDLLPVALGHPADPRTEVQLKDISELQHPRAVTHAPHPRHEVEEGPCRHLLHAGALAGQVT